MIVINWRFVQATPIQLTKQQPKLSMMKFSKIRYQHIHDFKTKAKKLCEIVFNKKTFCISYSDVLSDLNKVVFTLGMYGPIGENNLFRYLTDLKLLKLVWKRGHKSHIEIIGPKYTFLERSYHKIRDSDIPEDYILNCESIESFTDRRGLYGFTGKELNQITEKLKRLNTDFTFSPIPLKSTARKMAVFTKDTLFELTGFYQTIYLSPNRLYNSFDEHVQKRYKIDQDHDFRNFTTSILHKASDYDRYSCEGFISYSIRTLLNIFTTNDIKRFGFDQDVSEIVTILEAVKKSWTHHLIST